MGLGPALTFLSVAARPSRLAPLKVAWSWMVLFSRKKLF